jgi:outer membrane protein assembly factor BamB
MNMPNYKFNFSFIGKYQFLLTFLLCAVTGMSVTSCIPPNQTQRYENEGEKHVLVSSLNFEPLWDLHNISLEPVRGAKETWEEIFMVTLENKLSFINLSKMGRQTSLQTIDIMTGDVLWDVQVNSRPTAVARNSENIYMVTSAILSRIGEPELGAFTLTAYSIESGQIQWSNTYQGKGITVISSIIANDSRISVIGGGGHGAYFGAISLDPETGEEISYKDLTSEQSFTRLSGETIHYHQSEFVKDNITVFRSTRNEVFALNPLTGAILWDAGKQDIISNFAITDEAIYFLTSDAILHALSVETGEELDELIFEPGQLSTRLPYRHHVVAQDNIVIVYFGDSLQMFAFRSSLNGR